MQFELFVTIGSRSPHLFEGQVVGECNTPALTCYPKKDVISALDAESLLLGFRSDGNLVLLVLLCLSST